MPDSIRMVNWFLRRVFQTVCHIDVAEFRKIPTQGPFILVGNHVNFLETPVVMAHIDNINFTGLAKKESWDNPLFHFLFNTWGVIPLDRNGIDRDAFRSCIEALSNGKMLAVAPEGTRSRDGRLLPGKPGVVALAVRSQAPLLPVSFFGYEDFWTNLKHLRKTPFHVAVGKPFRIKMGENAVSRDVRQAVTDEIMCKIAELLPDKYHGYYSGKIQSEYQYLYQTD